MPKIKGIEEALKLLNALSQEESKKLIEKIRLSDNQMASLLEQKLISLEDLRFVTPSMLVGFLRDIDLKELGIALRGVKKEIVSEILGMVSQGLRLDIEEGLQGAPRKMSEVINAQEKVLKIFKEKVDLGHIVIDKEKKII